MRSVSTNHSTRSSSNHTSTCLWMAGSVVWLTAREGEKGRFLLVRTIFAKEYGRVDHQEAVSHHHQCQMPV